MLVGRRLVSSVYHDRAFLPTLWLILLWQTYLLPLPSSLCGHSPPRLVALGLSPFWPASFLFNKGLCLVVVHYHTTLRFAVNGWIGGGRRKHPGGGRVVKTILRNMQ